ncbi:zinc finger protein 454-like [Centruroides sculpturatus]|uniref:zinc finger protein 454-like n=1 Tax=Centruroides sculpturatus TaxID=218467 RepID=UPI000C6CF9C7|nr:zinc finger protein 454-like [Centruroides sculpturatus]
MKVHSDERPFKCNYTNCERSFKRKGGLDQHMYRMHPDEILSKISPNDPKIISRKCNFCLKLCASPTELRRHLRIHTKEQPFSCNFCNDTFTFKSSLNKHIRKIHPKENTPSCCEISTQVDQREQIESFEKPSTSFQKPQSIEFEKITSDQNLFTLKDCEEFLETINVNLGIIQQEGSSQQTFFPEVDVDEIKLECPFCREQFFDNVSFKEHKRKFHLSD